MDRGRPGPDRQHPRFTVDAFVRVLGATGGREFVFRVRDLSQGGMFLYTKVGHLYPFHEGTALTIELFDYDQAVEFKAVIVRIVQAESSEAERFPLGFGVKIVEIDEANRVRLDALLERAKKGEPLY
jgi:c-di-GMP-binding flagellar brake protein YcgR